MKKSIVLLFLSLKLIAFDFNEDEVKTIDNGSFKITEIKEERVITSDNEASIDDKIATEDDMEHLDSNEPAGTETTIQEPIEEVVVEKPFNVINYKDVKYHSGNLMYSVFKVNEKDFIDYLKSKKMSIETIKDSKDKVSDQNSIELNAYMYDLYLKKPNLAENYYKMFKDFPKLSMDNKVRYADFMIRTGRPSEIDNVISKKDCLSNISNSGICFYYIGLADYLLTGNNKNASLRISKSSIPKAREIFNLKKEKNK